MNRPYEPIAPAQPTWAERNQRWLVQRFAQLLALLQADDPTAATLAPDPAPDEAPDVAPLPDAAGAPALQRVARLFGLSPFEADLLLLAAGAECDTQLREALVQRDVAAPGVGVALALARLPGAHWDALSPLAPLRYWQLVRIAGDDTALGQARLRIDERVLHHLTGVAAFDERLHGIARLVAAVPDGACNEVPDGAHSAEGDRTDTAGADADAAAVATAMARALAAHPQPLVLLGLAAQQPAQRGAARALVLAALRGLALQALWVDAGALDADARALADTARALDREAALSGAAVVLALAAHGNDGAEAGAPVLRLLAQLCSPVVCIGHIAAADLADLPERRCTRFTVPTTPQPAHPNAALRRALQQFRVDADAVEQALAALPATDADADADAESASHTSAPDAALWQALRAASRGGLETLAQRIESAATLHDLVLPPAALSSLRDITLQLRHRSQVHDDWGFATPGGRGLGLAALFAGDSGTGKTFAAEAIANAVALDLYRVDLALTVSKYIGETEKNLRRLFDAAEASGAVLLFDEADALFGKRSDVKDSHDRYANIEVSYLLQRIESYRGLAILTTNLKSAIDRAFLRRIRFVVNFPFPDEAARSALWQRQFGPRAPLAADIDWRVLARLHLTGGSIRSVVLNGAFRAAADGRAIGQQHLLDAARAEYAKLDRSFGTAGGST